MKKKCRVENVKCDSNAISHNNNNIKIAANK